jgi:hypothetical protein
MKTNKQNVRIVRKRTPSRNLSTNGIDVYLERRRKKKLEETKIVFDIRVKINFFLSF